MMIDPTLITVSAVKLYGDPVALPMPSEWELSRSFDSPAHAFEGLFPITESLGELISLTVKCGAQTLFTGNVDEMVYSENDGGLTLRLMARSVGAVLLDNEAKPGIYRYETLGTLYTKLVRPLGFGALDMEINPLIDDYQVLKGTSVWEAFSNFYRNAILGFTWVTDQGIVRCRNLAPKGPRRFFSNTFSSGIHYSSLKKVDNRYSPVTEYIIRDADGVYSSSYDNLQNYRLPFKRQRYLNPLPDFSTDSTSRRKEAAMRCRRSMLGKAVFTLVCPGFLEIAVGDEGLIDTTLTGGGSLFIHQVRYKADQSGYTTIVTLVSYEFL